MKKEGEDQQKMHSPSILQDTGSEDEAVM